MSLVARAFASNPLQREVDKLIQSNMFNPEFEEKYFKLMDEQRSVRKIARKEESDLLHGEEGDMIYKYDLPVVNQPITFAKDLIKLEGAKGEATQV